MQKAQIALVMSVQVRVLDANFFHLLPIFALMSKRLPVTVLTGFLGTGKTTLLRHLLTHGAQRLAVMVNEFGSVGLDGDLIRSCGFCPEDELEARIVELNNGCLCCTVQDDFLPTIEKLLERSDQLDGIIVETSGLALPRPLLLALDWPAVRTRVNINGVVTLVDGEAILEGSPIGDPEALKKQREEDSSLDHLTPVDELFSDQLKAADLVLVSRADLLSSVQLKKIKEGLAPRVREGTPLLQIAFGQIDPALILGLDHFAELEPDGSLPEEDSDHEHSHHHHVEMKSGIVRLEGDFDRESLEALLPGLASNYEVVRLKGRFWLRGKSLPLQVQMVGPRLNTWFEAAPPTAWRPDKGGVDFVVLSFQDIAANEISMALKKTLR